LTQAIDFSFSHPRNYTETTSKFSKYLTQVVDKCPNKIDTFRYLDWIRLSLRGVSTFFAWTEIVPMSKELKKFMMSRQVLVKNISSSFSIPKFLISQIKLGEACERLYKNLACQQVNLYNAGQSAKKVVLSIIASAISTITLSLFLDRANLIDLGKILRMLPDKLAKGKNLLTFGLTSMSLIENIRTLWDQGGEVATEKRMPIQTVKSIVKISSDSFNLFSIAIAAAVLFLGVHTGPLVSALLSSASFSLSVTKEVVCHGMNLHYTPDRGIYPFHLKGAQVGLIQSPIGCL
jgi:hypothetical protein